MDSLHDPDAAFRNQRGLLVVIDGIDGSGKSTQVRMLHERLLKEGIASTTSCEPTKGPWGEKLRRSASEGRLAVEEEFEVICNDRKDDVKNRIEPGLAAGNVVIVDRYYTSTLCYQVIRGLAPETILERNRQLAPAPDVIVILDLATDMAFQRIQKRGQPPDTFETLDLALVGEKFRDLDLPGLVKIDAARPPKVVHAEIYEIVVTALERSRL